MKLESENVKMIKFYEGFKKEWYRQSELDKRLSEEEVEEMFSKTTPGQWLLKGTFEQREDIRTQIIKL